MGGEGREWGWWGRLGSVEVVREGGRKWGNVGDGVVMGRWEIGGRVVDDVGRV